MLKILCSQDFSLELWQNQKQEIVTEKVKEILQKVQAEGDQALYRLSEEQTGIKTTSLKIDAAKSKEAYRNLSQNELYALEIARKNITHYHQKTLPQNWQEEEEDKIWGQIFTPIEKVGIYIPAGLTAYPSSVLMNVIPAQLAKVPKIIVVSPATKTGLPHNFILAVLEFLGVKEIFCVGGAQAIAALAYGTESIPKVDFISGPGNSFVAEAKKQLFGKVGIDSIAGPSEVAILLDKEENCPLEWVAQDLITQAEHDTNAKAILLTNCEQKARKIQTIAKELVEKSNKKEFLRESLNHYGFIVTTQNLSEAVQIINQIAPEHLQVFSPQKELIQEIKNAGAIFWGKYSPVAMGDYIAGTNHTLPTDSTARFCSGLNTASFMKSSSYLEYKEKGFQKNAIPALTLAEIEQMTEHMQSIRQRLD